MGFLEWLFCSWIFEFWKLRFLIFVEYFAQIEFSFVLNYKFSFWIWMNLDSKESNSDLIESGFFGISKSDSAEFMSLFSFYSSVGILFWNSTGFWILVNFLFIWSYIRIVLDFRFCFWILMFAIISCFLKAHNVGVFILVCKEGVLPCSSPSQFSFFRV